MRTKIQIQDTNMNLNNGNIGKAKRQFALIERGRLKNRERSESMKKQASISENRGASNQSEVDVSKAAKEINQAVQNLNKMNKRVLAKIEDSIRTEIKKIPQIERERSIREQNQGVLFISGFDFWGLTGSDSDGMKQLNKIIPGSKYYGWDSKDKMLEHIRRLPRNAPLVLVGHSYGGDAAVEVANELNTAEGGYRKIDALVTIDSVGVNNDLIPENVKLNHHFFGEHDYFLNDGPNAPRDGVVTEVINELRQEGHSAMDNEQDVQLKIIDVIDRINGQ